MVVKVQQTSFDLLGKRWSALIVQDLIKGPRRFRELLGDLGRINDKVLSQRLKELEGRGIIKRQVFAEVPVRVEYRLTNKGTGLAGVIHAMEEWDSSWPENGNGAAKNGAQINVARQPVAEVEVGAEAKEPVTAAAPSDASMETRPANKSSFWKRFGR